MRVAILISGGGSNMETLVKHMQAHGYAEPVLVLSNRPDAGGLGKAERLGVPAICIDHKGFGKDRKGFERAVLEALRQARPDMICLAGFMRILSAEFINEFAGRILNIHPSLLPKYKGLHTHARAIAAGDSHAGCSVHIVTAELDDGPVLGQSRVAIEKGDTADSLADRVLAQEHILYPQCLQEFIAEIDG